MWHSEHLNIATQFVSFFQEKHLKISTAESCTGGLISGLITEISGASDILDQSFVTYANHAKEHLVAVSHQTLEQFGAVSFQTASEMAKGCRTASGSHYAISVTGIAGPSGGSNEKPVGLVYFGLSGPQGEQYDRVIFAGTRAEVRQQTVLHALKWSLSLIKKEHSNL